MSIIPHTPDTGTTPPVRIATRRGRSDVDWGARRLQGQGVDCGIDGCDRTDHDGNDPIEYWLHRVRSVTAYGLKLEAYVSDGRTLVYADSDLDGDHGMDAAGLRDLAKRLRRQAESVTAMAEWLDPTTRTLRRPVNMTEILRSREG